MTATKVECQELNSDGPKIEEIASYTFTLQDQSLNQPKLQNGVLIEEFSDKSEESVKKTRLHRGVTIVSVSEDEESTLRGLSRDVSVEDMQNAELYEDLQKITTNHVQEEEKFAYTRQLSLEQRKKAAKLTETILEEQSIEESSSKSRPKLSRENSKLESFNCSFENTVVQDIMDQRQTPTLSESKLTKHTTKFERMESTESTKSTETIFSRQNSQRGILCEETDEEFEALMERVQRQRSVLDEILDKESEKTNDKLTNHEGIHQGPNSTSDLYFILTFLMLFLFFFFFYYKENHLIKRTIMNNDNSLKSNY